MEINNPNAAANDRPNVNGAPEPPLVAQPPPPTAACKEAPKPPRRSNRSLNSPAPHIIGNIKPGAPALLEPSAAYPLQYDQRRTPNIFVPCAQMLFHVLGLCDHLMITVPRFTSSTHAWIPIVSQLYVSLLWNTMILQTYVRSGYGLAFESLLHQMLTVLQIGECMIPGPLVPFFQSLAAIAGSEEWIGDIFPAIPDFSKLWNPETFSISNNYARIFPNPAIMLDQLYHFATFETSIDQSITQSFEWYRNIFSQGLGTHNKLNRMGPQLCGTLYATETQCLNARDFWHDQLADNFTRLDATGTPLTIYSQLLGLVSQDGNLQFSWFPSVAIVMQKYADYFNGSVPLKAISPTGLGAVAIYGKPFATPSFRQWFYPPDALIAPFTSSRHDARRTIPHTLNVTFDHSDPNLEEQAEQFAITVHTNMIWSSEIQTANDWTDVDEAAIHVGDYWTEEAIRRTTGASLASQFLQMITSRYHRFSANRTD